MPKPGEKKQVEVEVEVEVQIKIEIEIEIEKAERSELHPFSHVGEKGEGMRVKQLRIENAELRTSNCLSTT